MSMVKEGGGGGGGEGVQSQILNKKILEKTYAKFIILKNSR